MALSFHHVGCVVPDLAAHAERYRTAFGFGRRSRAIDVPAQKVRVAFVEVGPQSYVELVQATSPSSFIDRYAKTGWYHVCFLAPEMDAASESLLQQKYVRLSTFESPAFDGRRCAFFASPEGHLVETAEMAPAEFAAFFEQVREP